MRTERAHIGFIGAGQLARMSAAPAIALDLRLAVLASDPSECAAQVIPNVTIGRPDDWNAVIEFASRCDVVTFDHELVDTALIDELESRGHVMRPSADVMRLSQSKRLQREWFGSMGLPIPEFLVVDRNRQGVEDVLRTTGFPVIVKADRGGYDGRGVWLVHGSEELERLLSDLERRGITPLLEARVDLQRELAIQVARTPSGETRCYPMVETIQVDGMLRELIAPAPGAEHLQDAAREIGERIASECSVMGLLAVELFEVDGRLVINEIATRPHNSGHASIEGSTTSQFEQHLRAVMDLPLGATAPTAPWAVTVNIVGGPMGGPTMAQVERVLAMDGVHIHLYGKESRPGRKIGHLTVLGADLDSTRATARDAASIMNGECRDV